MVGGKRIAVVIGLIAVVAVAGLVTLKRVVRSENPTPPQWMLDKPVEMIDEKTFELMTLKLSEWVKLGEKDGRHKNPNTGEYTMTGALTCGSCGEKIPPPPSLSPGQQRSAADYLCPKCGKRRS